MVDLLKYLKKFNKGKFKNADIVMETGMLLGLHQGLERKHLKHIYNSVELFLDKKIK